ncbi:MAG: pseudouridylate synthase, small subunit [Flaviaesturariibacter sp.]|nr:pseudouridylate synthase, small subunit [Flaviaesturariibacter sp.]
MVSQFTSPDAVRLLGDLDFPFPEGTHALGRLDSESEGLLILTTDKRMTRLLFSSGKPHQRSYLVMVQNEVSEDTLAHLQEGIVIPVSGGEPYIAKPVSVERITEPTAIYPYATDSREAYPHTWLLITLTEGKFRQVRKMVMAVRHRCLRLIRVSIGGLVLGDMLPGEVREVEGEELFERVGL